MAKEAPSVATQSSRTERVAVPFTLGSRRLFTVPRELAAVRYSLADLLADTAGAEQLGAPVGDGWTIGSAPLSLLDHVAKALPDYTVGGLQTYRRHYIAMDGGFENYMERFSPKTRSTLRRKQRKLDKEADGTMEIAAFRTPQEIAAFYDEAVPLSRRTYQARLLDAGLPDTAADRAEAASLAARDRVRAYLLRVHGKAIAYLFLPIEGDTLVYAHLGYDDDHAKLSPGTVLQLVALEQLFAEDRYRYFDFTEGEGAHKAMFGTDHVEACSFLLLKPSLSNRTLLGGLAAFDQSVATAKRVLEATGGTARLRKLLRG